MAYTAPTRWGHGDQPNSANTQPYSDDLTVIHDIIGDEGRNYAVLWNADLWPASYGSMGAYYMQHRYRYLIYRGEGELEDPSGAGETIALSGDGSSLIAYDLNDVEWMTDGKLYRVDSCVVCLEINTTAGI